MYFWDFTRLDFLYPCGEKSALLAEEVGYYGKEIVLSENGYTDEAYDLLFHNEYP